MDLNEIAVYLKVIQTGSFTQAAKAMGLPISTVSSKVARLEEYLGITLIQRTTRKLNVTAAGQTFYQRCLTGLEQIKSAETEILQFSGEPKGILRITAPQDMGRSLLPEIISRFTRAYPDVCVEVILTDRRVDLLSEGIELAIRAGVLKDSTLIAKKLGESYFVPVASAKYLKANGIPKHPRDLKEHFVIAFPAVGTEEWKFQSSKGSIAVSVKPRVILNDLEGTYRLAYSGEGIAMVPAYMCYEDINAGKIERILPEWKSLAGPVHFVYPAQKFVSPKLQAFMKIASEEMKKTFVEQDV